MGDTTADSLRRGALTVKLNELQPDGEVAFKPVQSHATYTIVFEFVKQNIIIDGITRNRKSLGGVYMRKLAPARVSHWDDFFISYRVYMMPGSFHI